jgi:hypothetical protein
MFIALVDSLHLKIVAKNVLVLACLGYDIPNRIKIISKNHIPYVPLFVLCGLKILCFFY